jgi:tRNA A37 methylthiotransferase MiaB
VKPLVAANRARKLMALQRKIAREKNRALVGKSSTCSSRGRARSTSS